MTAGERYAGEGYLCPVPALSPAEAAIIPVEAGGYRGGRAGAGNHLPAPQGPRRAGMALRAGAPSRSAGPGRRDPGAGPAVLDQPTRSSRTPATARSCPGTRTPPTGACPRTRWSPPGSPCRPATPATAACAWCPHAAKQIPHTDTFDAGTCSPGGRRCRGGRRPGPGTGADVVLIVHGSAPAMHGEPSPSAMSPRARPPAWRHGHAGAVVTATGTEADLDPDAPAYDKVLAASTALLYRETGEESSGRPGLSPAASMHDAFRSLQLPCARSSKTDSQSPPCGAWKRCRSHQDRFGTEMGARRCR